MNTITDLIKQLRAAGYSQSEIARQTGITQSTISRWEAGQIPCVIDAAEKFKDFAMSALSVAHSKNSVDELKERTNHH